MQVTKKLIFVAVISASSLVRRLGGIRGRQILFPDNSITAAVSAQDDVVDGDYVESRIRIFDRRWPSNGENVTRPRTLHTMETNGDQSRCAYTKSDEIRTTLVTQSTLNRAWLLEEICRRWSDPIVAVVSVADSDLMVAGSNGRGSNSSSRLLYNSEGLDDEKSITALLESSVSGWIGNCTQLYIVGYRLDARQSGAGMYPINLLRNVALDFVETSHVLLIDIDFMPSRGLDNTIRSVLEDRQEAGTSRMDAIVVPAFERHPQCQDPENEECYASIRSNGTFVPQTFLELKSCHERGECDVFHSRNFNSGHSTTNSEAWLAKRWYEWPSSGRKESPQPRQKKIRSISCFRSSNYEPYLVIQWCSQSRPEQRIPSPPNAGNSSSGIMKVDNPAPAAPYYDERFHGYGLNKVQYVSHLRSMGYSFSVLPKGFLCHNPHAESDSRLAFKLNPDGKSGKTGGTSAKNGRGTSDRPPLRNEMEKLYKTFTKDLNDKYLSKAKPVVPLCRSKKKGGSSTNEVNKHRTI